MNIAITEAEKAYKENNVPVGAVIVKENKILSAQHNTKNTSNVAINHAEILCIIEANNKLNSWYLENCEIYVTLKPCNMCMAALAEARIKKVHYLLDSNYYENLNKNIENVEMIKNSNAKYNEYQRMLSNFFQNLRN